MTANGVKNETMHITHVPYRLASAYLSSRLKANGMTMPVLGIICGSGLSGLSHTLTEPTLTIKYSEIIGFPAHCTVPGHKGEVVFGMLAGVPAMCFRGRFHSFEGHDMKTVVLPVYVMRCLNVKIVIITNAAGGLNPEYKVGDVVAVSDHLAIPQLAGNNALIGPNDDALGPRFPATSDCYDEVLRATATKAADILGITFLRPHGTYCFVAGPMYESKAECRFLRTLGGDCVGMSTIPEIVAAHHCNMKSLCLSLVTNAVVMEGDEGAPVASHTEVMEVAEMRSKEMQSLVLTIVATMREEVIPNLPDFAPVSHHVPLKAKRSFIESVALDEYGVKKQKEDCFVCYAALACALIGTGAVVGLLICKKSR